VTDCRALIRAGLIGCCVLTAGAANALAEMPGTWFGRNLGLYVGSDSYYPNRQEGGYYYPSYKHGGPRCFGYTPAFIPGAYPGVYGGWDHFKKGPSGCDPRDPKAAAR
jgi:hypothetical protein